MAFAARFLRNCDLAQWENENAILRTQNPMALSCAFVIKIGV